MLEWETRAESLIISTRKWGWRCANEREREKQDVITPFLFFWPALHSLVAHFEVTSELSHTWLSCLRVCQRVRGKINEIPLSYQSTVWLLFLKAPSLESETAKCRCPGLRGFLNNCNILLQPSPCFSMLFISPTATSITLKFWNLVTLTSQFPTYVCFCIYTQGGSFFSHPDRVFRSGCMTLRLILILRCLWVTVHQNEQNSGKLLNIFCVNTL